MEIQKGVLASKTEIDQLIAENENLEVDITKTKKDFLEMTKKLAIQHNEHQTKIKELLSFIDRQIFRG